LVQKLECRGIAGRDDLHAYRHAAFPDVSAENLERLAEEENDWKVYDFVNRFSNLFRVPDNVAFQVHKPLVLLNTVSQPPLPEEIRAEQGVEGRHAAAECEVVEADDFEVAEAGEETEGRSADGDANDEALVDREVRELLIKVSWKQRETLRFAGDAPRSFEFRYGTTVSFDLDRKIVLVRLTTNADGYSESANVASQRRQQQAR
jgi:hypothetical protein